MTNEHVLIIGGGRGLGRAVAQKMNKAGYRVTIISKTETKDKIGGVSYRTADITKTAAIPGVLEAIARLNGRFNHLIFCQQYRGEGDQWTGQIETSLTATKEIIEQSVEHFLDDNKGKTITIVGSVAGRFVANDKPVGYHVAKASIEHMVRYYALLLGPKGIRVNGVSPNVILKDENKEHYENNKDLCELYAQIAPLGRMVSSADVAETIIFLCSPSSSMITGQVIVIDGGISLQEHWGFARALMSLKRETVLLKK